MKLKNSILVLALAFSVINLNINNLTRYNENKSFISNNNIKQNSRSASSNIPDDKYFSKGEEIITNIGYINPRITIENNQYFLTVRSLGDYKPYQYYPSTSSPISSSDKQLTQYPISTTSRYFYIIYKKYEKYPKQLTKDDFNLNSKKNLDLIYNRVWYSFWLNLKYDNVSFCYMSKVKKTIDGNIHLNDAIRDSIKEELMPKFIAELNSSYFRYKTAVLDLQEALYKGYISNQSINIDTLGLTPKINKWYQIKYKKDRKSVV